MKEKIVEKAKAEIESRLAARIKENTVDDYEHLLATIWDKITPTLGPIAVATIVDSAIRRTTVEHEVVRLLSVDQNGIDFDQLKRIAGDNDQAALGEGFKLLLANLFDILAKLTGDGLVNDLIKVVEEKP